MKKLKWVFFPHIVTHMKVLWRACFTAYTNPFFANHIDMAALMSFFVLLAMQINHKAGWLAKKKERTSLLLYLTLWIASTKPCTSMANNQLWSISITQTTAMVILLSMLIASILLSDFIIFSVYFFKSNRL